MGELFDKEVVKLTTNILNIHLNEIRKHYISIGYYEEKDLT